MKDMNVILVDQDSLALAAQAATALTSLEGLLLSEHPGVGMISPEDWIDLAQHLHLSAREFSVAVLLFEGNSRFRIAKRLKCSPETSRVYIDRIFAKLNVEDRLDMVLRVMRVHLALVALRP